MDRIFVEQISFVGHHGVSRRERDEGRQLLVDLVACLDTRAAAAEDRLDQTVNHEDLARIAFELGTASSFHLLETLADRIASAILEHTPAVEVEVRVRKVLPGLHGTPQATGVSIGRRQDGSCFTPVALVP